VDSTAIRRTEKTGRKRAGAVKSTRTGLLTEAKTRAGMGRGIGKYGEDPAAERRAGFGRRAAGSASNELAHGSSRQQGTSGASDRRHDNWAKPGCFVRQPSNNHGRDECAGRNGDGEVLKDRRAVYFFASSDKSTSLVSSRSSAFMKRVSPRSLLVTSALPPPSDSS
jgi:hypothetical protein